MTPTRSEFNERAATPRSSDGASARDAAAEAMAERARRPTVADAKVAERRSADAAGETRRRRARPRPPSRSRRSSRGCAASRTSTPSSSRSSLGAGLIVARQRRRGDGSRSAIYAAQPLGAVRGQRPLSPGRLAAAAARRWMRRLDHTMIFFLIAGTVTPFALLVMERAAGDRAPGRRLGRGAGRARRRADLGRRAEVGGGDRLPRGRADRRDRLPGDRRRGRDRRRRS